MVLFRGIWRGKITPKTIANYNPYAIGKIAINSTTARLFKG